MSRSDNTTVIIASNLDKFNTLRKTQLDRYDFRLLLGYPRVKSNEIFTKVRKQILLQCNPKWVQAEKDTGKQITEELAEHRGLISKAMIDKKRLPTLLALPHLVEYGVDKVTIIDNVDLELRLGLCDAKQKTTRANG